MYIYIIAIYIYIYIYIYLYIKKPTLLYVNTVDIYIVIWLSYIPINFQILQIFRTLFNINTLTEKKVFVMNFPFFNGLSQSPTPPFPPP